MKIKQYLTFLFIAFLVLSCSDDDNQIQDDIFEFVFFQENAFVMNELLNSEPGTEIEMNLEMLAFPRSTDVVVSLSVTGINAEEGTDYEIVSPVQEIIIPAGETRSTEGFKIRSTNNTLQSIEERQIIVAITAVSDPNLNIGERLDDPESGEATITIVDDECSDTIALFNNAVWEFAGSNTVYFSDYTGSYVTQVNGDKITITGDIANYDVGITVTATIVPNPDAPTTGTLIYDASTEGNDGTYDYRWVMGEEGTYDICARTMTLSTTIQYIDIFGPDPTAWVDWYTSTITANITVEGGEGAAAPNGTVIETLAAAPGSNFSLTGTINDLQGLTGINIVSADLGINENIGLSGELTFELDETFTVPAEIAEGAYTIETTANNIEGESTTFTTTVNVNNNAGCSDDFTIFDNQTMDANVFFSETDGSFDPYEYSNTVSTALNGNELTVSGNFIDFFDVDLTLTMEPDENDASFGAAVFDIEDLGEAEDGFVYRLVQVSPGTYDACSGTINVVVDIEYEDGGNWVFYYRTEAEFSIP
jgi:hypothetical protein